MRDHASEPAPASPRRAPGRHVAAYAACAWAFVFAVPSLAWAAGVDLGTETIAEDVNEAGIADPVLLAVTGALKVLAGLVALALARPWGRRIPRRLLLVAAWGAAAVFLAYAVLNLVDHGLMEAGARAIPEELGADAVRWHLLLWDPWWLLGGILFAVAAWQFSRASAATV
jgi:Protein of unknown function (DUF3995)